jgi:signal transduction histidine kinase
LLGKLEARRGMPAEARGHLQAAVSEFRDLEAPFELAQALGALALLPVADGLAPERASLQEALALYQSMGVHHLYERLRHEALASRPVDTAAPTKLRTLLQTTARLGRSLQLEPVLADIVEHAVEFTAAARGVLLLESADGSLVPKIARDREGRPLEVDRLRLSQTAINQVRTSGQPLCLTDLASDRGYRDQQSIVELGLQTIMCVPLQVDGIRLGLLYVDNQTSSGAVYGREDLEFLEALAQHAALALHKAQTHEALVQSYQSLEASRDELQQAYEQLQQLQQSLLQSEKKSVLGQMAASVVHELKQPLTAVMTSNELGVYLIDRARGQIDPAQLRAQFEKAVHAAEHMSGILGNIQRFSRRSDESRERMHLADAVHNALRLVQHQLSHCGIRVEAETDTLPEILGNSGQMTQIFVNLLVNARDALEGQARGRVRIHGGRDPLSGEGWLRFEDDGPGIPAEHRQRIFEPFFTTKPGEKGTDAGRGACFLLRFPPVPA